MINYPIIPLNKHLVALEQLKKEFIQLIQFIQGSTASLPGSAAAVMRALVIGFEGC